MSHATSNRKTEGSTDSLQAELTKNSVFSPEDLEGGHSCSCSACSDVDTLKSSPKIQDNWWQRSLPFWFAAVLLAIGIGISRFAESSRIREILILVLFGMSYLIAGYRIIRSVISNLRSFFLFDENFLMVIATVGAILTDNFIEAIAVMLFFNLGELLEAYSVAKSKKSITALLDSRPEFATVIRTSGIAERVLPKTVQVGETIQVKPGEKIPLDGILTSPMTTADASVLTGEVKPRVLRKGDMALSGMVNLSHLATIETTSLYENSTIARILHLVENAESKKSKTEKFITKFARIYTPIVVLLALLLAVIPPLVFPGQLFQDWLYRGLIFLVISCPCALVISVPLTYFGGIGAASRHGILIKGTQHIEALAGLDTLIFDKTGTLTEGKFKVQEIQTHSGVTKNEFLKIVAQVEQYSTHPIAISIREEFLRQESFNMLETGDLPQKNANSKTIMTYNVREFHELPSFGVLATVDGLPFVAGNDKILHKYEIEHDHSYCGIKGTVVHAAHGGQYLGYLIIHDETKADAQEALHSLRRLGITNQILLSGDEESIVQELAEDLQIPRYYAGLLPEDKVDLFSQFRNEGKRAAFIGDGINDAPVIATADVGIALGGMGSHAAIESADVVLMEDRLIKVPQAISIAKQTRKINGQNIALIFAVKLLFMAFGAFGLMNMWGAVFADVGMALITILNARRILRYTPLD